MVLIGFLLLFAEFDPGAQREAEEEDLFSTGNAGKIAEFLVDEGVQVGLESLIAEQLLGGVLFCAKIDDFYNPNGS